MVFSGSHRRIALVEFKLKIEMMDRHRRADNVNDEKKRNFCFIYFWNCFIKLTHFYADTFASNVSTMESAIVTELAEKYDPNMAPPT